MVLPAASGRLPICSAAAIAAPDEMPPGMPSLRASAREVSIAVARATAFQARKEGLTDLAEDEIEAAIHAKMWSPKYLPYRRTRARHDDRP